MRALRTHARRSPACPVPPADRRDRAGRFFADWASAQRPSGSRPADDDGVQQRAGAPRPGVRLATRLTALGLACAAVTAAAVVAGPSAMADPSASDWARLRMCESGDNYRINTGNGHYGAYQFDLATWESVGGHGYPNLASPAEQDARALILYRERGWQPWQCASILGLRPDGDAGSGRISDIHVPGSSGSSGHTPGSHSRVPAYPDNRSWFPGDSSDTIRRFQDRMHVRGAIPPGTGYYGPLTKAVVVRLQQLNGIPASGTLGPLTWRAAWTGKWSEPASGPTHTPTQPRHRHVPAYPATHSFFPGDSSPVIKRFQDRMHRRGAIPPGTGYYGPLTHDVVVRLQRENGITPSGILGPLTWRAAWAGTYHK